MTTKPKKLTLAQRVDLLAEMVAILIEQQAVSAFALRDAGDKSLRVFNETCDKRLRDKKAKPKKKPKLSRADKLRRKVRRRKA